MNPVKFVYYEVKVGKEAGYDNKGTGGRSLKGTVSRTR